MKDEDEVTNVFTIGNVRIELDEGSVWNAAAASGIAPTSAQNIEPGQSIEKAPVVKNVGSNPAYIYTKVYVPVYDDGTTVYDLFSYTLNPGWTKRSEELHTTDNKYNIYVYEYNQALQPSTDTPAVFSEVVFAPNIDFTPEQAAQLGGNSNELNVKVKAYAIQSENGVTKASNEMTTQMTSETGEASGLVTSQGGQSADPINTQGTVAYEAHQGNVHVGDSVNYDPGSGSISSGDLQTAGVRLIGDTRVASINGASFTGTIDAEDGEDWIVLDVDQANGIVKIVPKSYSSTVVRLEGIDGYNNAITALNQVASVYKNPTYASSARSLTVEDVNKIEFHTPDGNVDHTVFDNDYAMNSSLDIVSSSAADAIKETIETESDGETITLSGNIYTSTEATGYYVYSLSDFATLMDNYYGLSCWLASRCVGVYSYGCCNFLVRNLSNGSVYYDCLFYVDDNGSAGSDDGSYPVLPVVTLKSDIQMAQSNGVWQLTANQ